MILNMQPKLKIFVLTLILFALFGGFFWYTHRAKRTHSLEDKYQFSSEIFQGISFDTAIIKSENKNSLEFYYKDSAAQKLTNIGHLKNWLADQDKELIFATNGGIFSPAYTPLGLYIENGTTISELNIQKGEGNFYLEPNGVFLLKTNEAKIVETAHYQFSPDITFAIQSGPLLVNQNEINPLFNKNSENTYTRSGVGIKENGDIVFAISNEPVTFYQFAAFFKDILDCPNALYLDGAISEMYVPGYREHTNENFSVMIGMLDI